MEINTEFAVIMTAVTTLIVVLFAAIPIIWHHEDKRRYAEDKWSKVSQQDYEHCQEIERLKRELEQLCAADDVQSETTFEDAKQT